MKINSKDFGLLDVAQEDIINFPNGLFAFEEEHKFVLIDKDGYEQKYLQSVRAEYPRFVVFDPGDIVAGYQPKLSKEVLTMFEADGEEALAFYVIAMISENLCDMTVNLKSPVIINKNKKLGAQIILDQQNYPIRYKVFSQERRDSAC